MKITRKLENGAIVYHCAECDINFDLHPTCPCCGTKYVEPVWRHRAGTHSPTLPVGDSYSLMHLSERVDAALRAYEEHDQVDHGKGERLVLDLLCDLRHWCDREGVDIGACLSGSLNVYKREINGNE